MEVGGDGGVGDRWVGVEAGSAVSYAVYFVLCLKLCLPVLLNY